MKVADPVREMRGEGAPKSTTFGVIGATKESPKMKSLGGLVHHTSRAKPAKGELMKPRSVETERDITGPASKTHVPGAHFAQVPYAGMFMSHLGHAL